MTTRMELKDTRLKCKIRKAFEGRRVYDCAYRGPGNSQTYRHKRKMAAGGRREGVVWWVLVTDDEKEFWDSLRNHVNVFSIIELYTEKRFKRVTYISGDRKSGPLAPSTWKVFKIRCVLFSLLSNSFDLRHSQGVINWQHVIANCYTVCNRKKKTWEKSKSSLKHNSYRRYLCPIDRSPH